jgi:hypothetical protein
MSSYEQTRLANIAGSAINPATKETQEAVEAAIGAVEVAVSSLNTSIGLLATLTETQPISAAALPLPAGASTEGKQDSLIAVFQLDAIKAIPRTIDSAHSEVHAGNMFKALAEGIPGTATVKFAIETSTEQPHLLINCDVYDGSARVDLYKSATFTGGTALTAHNRNQNSSNTPATTITKDIVSSDGVLIDSFYVGLGDRSARRSRAAAEWVLEVGSIYRVDAVPLDTGAKLILSFDWY